MSDEKFEEFWKKETAHLDGYEFDDILLQEESKLEAMSAWNHQQSKIDALEKKLDAAEKKIERIEKICRSQLDNCSDIIADAKIDYENLEKENKILRENDNEA